MEFRVLHGADCLFCLPTFNHNRDWYEPPMAASIGEPTSRQGYPIIRSGHPYSIEEASTENDVGMVGWVEMGGLGGMIAD